MQNGYSSPTDIILDLELKLFFSANEKLQKCASSFIQRAGTILVPWRANPQQMLQSQQQTMFEFVVHITDTVGVAKLLRFQCEFCQKQKQVNLVNYMGKEVYFYSFRVTCKLNTTMQVQHQYKRYQPVMLKRPTLWRPFCMQKSDVFCLFDVFFHTQLVHNQLTWHKTPSYLLFITTFTSL